MEDWKEVLKKKWYLWNYDKKLKQYTTCENEVIDFIEQELSKAREELLTKEEVECILRWKDACDGEFNGMTLLPVSGEDWGDGKDIESAEEKLRNMLSKLKNNK